MAPAGRATSARSWAIAASLLAHLLPLAWLLRAEAPEPGAAAVGTGGIEVALGPSGGAVGASVPERPFEEVAPVETSALEPTPVEPEEAIAAEAAPVEATAEPPPEAVAAAVPPEAEPITAAPEVAAAEEAAPAPAPRPVRRPPVRVAAAEPRREPPPAPAAPAPGNAGRGGSGQIEAAGADDARTGGGAPGTPADYLTALQAWLERHKEYPRQAKLRRQEGTVLLSFTFDRAGRVLGHHIARSSGHAALDREVAAMLDRAQPLPPIPAAMTQARLEVTVPVLFALR